MYILCFKIKMPTFESALSKSGWGPYYYGVLCLCGLCALAEAVVQQSGVISLSLSKCDLRLTSNNIILLSSLVSIGTAIGGYIIGSASDVSGRKCAIPLSLLLMFSGAIGCSFSSSIHMLLVCMLLMGIGLGSHSFAARILLAEILPQRVRGLWIVFLDFMCGVGYIIGFVSAWTILPSALHYASDDFRPNSWRVLLALSACLCIMVACLMGILSPSPRFLLVKQRISETIDVFRQMYAINTSNHIDNYQIPDLTDTVKVDTEEDLPGALCTEYIKYFVKRLYQLTVRLFKKNYRKQTVISILINIALFPGQIMAILWTRQVMNWSGVYQLDVHSTPSKSQCQTRTDDLLDDVGCYGISKPIFIELLSLSGSMAAANFILMFIIDRAGHRTSLGVSFIVVCVCSTILLFNIPHLLRIFVCCIFIAAYIMASSAFKVISIEIYPTSIRGTANGVIPFISRMIYMIVKFYMNVWCEVSLFCIAGLMFVAAGLTWLLPDQTKKPMREEIMQQENT